MHLPTSGRHQVASPEKTEHELRRKHDLLTRLTKIQSDFIADADSQEVFDLLLTNILELTESVYGFIGRVEENPDGQPYLRTHAITNIAWSEETHLFYDENISKGIVFANLDTLFGEVLKTGQPVISNLPSKDPRSGGLPAGHPPLFSFLGLPFYSGSTMIGMVGVANRAGGYDTELIDFLQPILATCANLIRSHTNERLRQASIRSLELSEARFRTIFEGAAVSLWEEDITAVRALFDELRSSGVNDLRAHIADYPEFVVKAISLIKITDVNEESLKIFKAPDKMTIINRLRDTILPESLPAFEAALVAIFEGQTTLVTETLIRSFDGQSFNALVQFNVPSETTGNNTVLVSITDITPIKTAERERENLIQELQQTLTEVKRLSGLLPICSHCKKIRDDGGQWQDVAVYVRDRSEADFTHSFCPDCADLYLSEMDLEPLP